MSRKIQKIKKHLRHHRPRYIKVGVIVFVLVGVLWVTFSSDDGGGRDSSWDGKKEALMGVSYSESFEEAKGLDASGDEEAARALMRQLAPLSEGTIQPRGYGPAHWWMARKLLGYFKSDFLQVFPINTTEGHPSEVPVSLHEDKKVLRAQLHLEHAMYLAPELVEPARMLAAVWVARGKREQALDVLIQAIAHPTHPHPELQVTFAHVLMYAGDDLAMEEKAWGELTVLGRSVGRSHEKDDLVGRIKYAMNALILKKFDLVESIARKMERDFSDSQEFPHAEASIQGLRTAILYHQAILLAGKATGQPSAKAGETWSEVLDVIGKVLEIQSDHVSSIQVLSMLSKKQPELKGAIKKMIKKSAEESSKGEKHPSGSGAAGSIHPGNARKASAQSHLLLGALADGDREETQKHLEAALVSAPDDHDVLMALAKLLSQGEKPDYLRVLDLASKAIELNHKQGVKAAIADDYLLQGRAFLELGKNKSAIVSLEKSLSYHSDGRTLHLLLARAYRNLGKLKLAQAHEDAAGGGGK